MESFAKDLFSTAILNSYQDKIMFIGNVNETMAAAVHETVL